MLNVFKKTTIARDAEDEEGDGGWGLRAGLPLIAACSQPRQETLAIERCSLGEQWTR